MMYFFFSHFWTQAARRDTLGRLISAKYGPNNTFPDLDHHSAL